MIDIILSYLGYEWSLISGGLLIVAGISFIFALVTLIRMDK